MKTILVTGGAGFIGSCLVRRLVRDGHRVVNLDLLTYAGSLDSLPSLDGNPRHQFVRGDIADRPLVRDLLASERPCAAVHCAAETHVDRSIDSPEPFVRTNVLGTVSLLQETLDFWRRLTEAERQAFRFLHVSTDEVYGTLGSRGTFTEESPYAPNSPYSASKASSDHFVRAYHETFGLPTMNTHCSNNFGPYQYPEKLIPLMVLNALERKPLPVYGDGLHVRDWLHVEDHCDGLLAALYRGQAGETYNFGGHSQQTNLEVVRMICDCVEEMHGGASGQNLRKLITHVADRPGHDRRYAIDTSKASRELEWSPRTQFPDGLRQTVRWYLDNLDWVERVTKGKYERQRLGLSSGDGTDR